MCKVKDVMSFLQLFVSNILIFLVEVELTSTETGISNNITPLHYQLDLWPHIDFNYFFVHCRIIIRIEKEIQEIRFFSTASIRNAKLQKIDLINGTRLINTTYEPRNVLHYPVTKDIILHFDEIMERGYYILEVEYRNNFTDSIETNGFIRTSCMDVHGNRKWMVTTQTREGCPQALFPCWNNSHYTITFEMSINHPSNYMAISNSKIHCYTGSGQRQDLIWTHFQSTSPIFPHCINIVIMPTYYYHKLGHNIRIWTSSKLRLSQSISNFTEIIIKNVTDYLKTTTNLVDHCKAAYAHYIAIKNFPLEIITTPSFVIFREEDISVSNTTCPNQKEEANIALVIVQQMVYQRILQSTKLLEYSVFSWLQDVSKFFTVYILEQVLPEFEVYTSPIQSVYKNANFTSLVFNMKNIIEFIIFSRTPLVSFYDRDFDKEEVSP